MRFLLILVLFIASCQAAGNKWAVLVSGSKGFGNYRHQANICHAYHVLINRGFLPSNIILFSYNDAASSPQNPFPGKLFNKPEDNAIDYNQGCIMDYTGNLVTPQNFINVITGNSLAMRGKGTQKVLKSTSEDNVFIYFTDHGGPSLIAFPNGYLYAYQLSIAFRNMYSKRMYNRMVVYIEACESGSMFEEYIETYWNILAVTSSRPGQNGYATYCPPDDIVDGTHIGTCLGDQFSASFLEDCDRLIEGETLQDQINIMRLGTTLSNVTVYGTTNFTHHLLENFVGTPVYIPEAESFFMGENKNGWSTRDANFITDMYTYISNPTDENAELLINDILKRQRVQRNFGKFVDEFSEYSREMLLKGKHTVRNFDCFEDAINEYEAYCGVLDEFSLGYVQTFVNACESGINKGRMKTAIRKVCKDEDDSGYTVASMLI